jgi:hypothetical protein
VLANEELEKMIKIQSKQINYLTSLVEELVLSSDMIEKEKKKSLLKQKSNKSNYLSIRDLSERTTYSVSTLYSKIKLLKKGEHYFYSRGERGKLMFDESAVDFLARGTTYKKVNNTPIKKPIYIDDFLNKTNKI